jgi:DNA primase
MRIPDDIIERVKASVPIEDLVGEFVTLRKTGQNYSGLCPFHTEKTPSFTVSPSKGIFHCFGCSTGGNVFSFLMKINNISFPESVRFLAARAGIAIPEDGAQTPEDVERENVLKINEKAAYIYHFYLTNKPEGKEARDYLARRKITAETIAKFQIGFSPFKPEEWDRLYKDLKESKFSDELILKAWLCQRNKRGGFYDYFRGRLMFPIHSVSNRVIGFGGRVLSDEDKKSPKYMNSGETPAFHKSEVLFGLNHARNAIREADEIIIVEGYFDVIMLHQNGIRNAVAPLGTALTREHMHLVGRYTRNVTLIFDADPAGEKATWRSIELLLEGEYKIRILRLPMNMDPFDYLNAHPPESFLKIKDSAPDVFTYMIDFMKQKLDLKTMMGKMKLLSYIYKYLVKIASPVEQDLVFGLLVRELDVSVEALRLEFGRFKSDPKNFFKPAVRPAAAGPSPVRSSAAPAAAAGPSGLFRNMEREFIVLLLLHTDQLESVMKVFNAGDFSDPLTRKAFGVIEELQAEKPGFTKDDFLNRAADPEIASVLTGIMFTDKFKAMDPGTDAKTAGLALFADYRNKFHVRKLDLLIAHIKASISASQQRHDTAAVQELQQDLARAIADRNRLRTKTRD